MWNSSVSAGGSGAKPESPSPRRRGAAFAVAALLALAVATVAYLAWPCGKKAPDGAKAPARRAKRLPLPARSAATNSVAEAKAAATNAPPANPLLPKVMPKTIAEAVSMVRLKPGIHWFRSVEEVFTKTNEHQVGEYKAPLFKRGVERHLELIATRRRDMMTPPMPPMPPNAEREFVESLSEGVVPAEGDTPEDSRTRERVETMKREMERLIDDEGLTFGQAYCRIEAEHNRRANLVQLYRGEYVKMLRSGSPDASAFLERANDELRAAGACELGADGAAVDP